MEKSREFESPQKISQIYVYVYNMNSKNVDLTILCDCLSTYCRIIDYTRTRWQYTSITVSDTAVIMEIASVMRRGDK